MVIGELAIAIRLFQIFGQHVWTVGYPAQVYAMEYAFADEVRPLLRRLRCPSVLTPL
jgi:hypothetical protein